MSFLMVLGVLPGGHVCGAAMRTVRVRRSPALAVGGVDLTGSHRTAGAAGLPGCAKVP